MNWAWCWSLEYHKITKPEDQNAPEPDYCRSALHFKQDIELLKSEGYYPITVKELATGNIAIPPCKSPVVLTFDDSSPGQYRVLEDGSIDPECAVGILQAAAKDGTWPMKASFFVLLDVTPRTTSSSVNQTCSRRRCATWSSGAVRWKPHLHTFELPEINFGRHSQRARALQAEDRAVGGRRLSGIHAVRALRRAYPEDVSILRSGEHEGVSYAYKAALEVAGGPSYSPFSTSSTPCAYCA